MPMTYDGPMSKPAEKTGGLADLKAWDFTEQTVDRLVVPYNGGGHDIVLRLVRHSLGGSYFTEVTFKNVFAFGLPLTTDGFYVSGISQVDPAAVAASHWKDIYRVAKHAAESATPRNDPDNIPAESDKGAAFFAYKNLKAFQIGSPGDHYFHGWILAEDIALHLLPQQ